MGQPIERSEADALRIATNAHLTLTRVMDLLKLAQTASTKEEALRFIKELNFAQYQAIQSFEPEEDDPYIPNVEEFIRNGTGDFKALTELYKSLGAV